MLGSEDSEEFRLWGVEGSVTAFRLRDFLLRLFMCKGTTKYFHPVFFTRLIYGLGSNDPSEVTRLSWAL